MLGQVLKFCVIGGLATLVHLVVGLSLIYSGLYPALANTIAFVTAFLVSFIGHISFSFAHQGSLFTRALWRFGLVGLVGFGINQNMLFVLIAFSLHSAPTALVFSTICAAVVTFVLCRSWAFQPATIAGRLQNNSQ